MDDETKPEEEESSNIGGGGPTMTEADIAGGEDSVGMRSGEHGEVRKPVKDRPHQGSAGSGGHVD